ncbi:MAG: FixH family protein [Bacteroidota bacterium]
MHFGKWIVVAFVLFAGFIATLVTVCIRADVNLVSKNYYQEELKHQNKIDKVQHTALLAAVPALTASEGKILLQYADFAKVDGGTLRVLRPSDPSLDHDFDLSDWNSETHVYELTNWSRGLYRITLEWTMNGTEYYLEKTVVL